MQPANKVEATPEYLTTRELADLLRIKERKVYDLASAGAVPCAKVTGKLLFPTRDIHAWLADARIGPRGQQALPNVFLGSHDPLLEWSLRESRSTLATYFDSSLDGLERFAAREGIATGLHVYSPASKSWNQESIEQRCSDMDAVLIHFAVRTRGLVTATEAPLTTLDSLKGRTVVQRQAESGAEPLFQHLLSNAGVSESDVDRTAPIRSEADAALAILRGDADAAFGLEAFATQYKLAFTPLVSEHFDILVDRRAYFEPGMQTLLSFCESDAFMHRAKSLSGYDLTHFGKTVWNS